MLTQWDRETILLGDEALNKLASSHVIVFGVGGVGSYAVEALARSGIGQITLVDHDRVSLTNLNRQLVALHSTLDQYKVNVASARIKDIAPECKVNVFPVFFSEETESQFDFSTYDYVVDAIDSVKSKIRIIEMAKEKNIPIISAMGAGNKMDPTQFRVADISETSVCPLAKIVRLELRKKGIESLKVVYSEEVPMKPNHPEEWEGKRAPGSLAFVPSVAGLILAGEVIRDIAGYSRKMPKKRKKT